ncbi:hypothetical protein W97_01090 [Coniosporium apollinis CBS 100218]|uniref:EF-hand domain-containing protein n=1 Tax=Coniosporium apollinis (strain CBS 100218) TaxID=1168221 RepID=R7YIX1_CONA1|nr:uncharacterized protein W97_01090 [Coniosporium apollinis CBS 100218]EON61872.1 hypothetical protein W97_01090 [Coniosporium apollinis CBS 100218]
MAYNKGYNPDALPAHAEPEQAAQLLSQSQQAARPPRTSSRPDTYASKPAAAPASSLRPRDDDRYARPNAAYSSSSGGGGQAGGGGGASYRDERDRYADRPAPLSYINDSRRRESSSPRYAGYGSPPPPADYGHGPPPASYHGRPPLTASSRPPPTPAPPRDSNDRDALWRIFNAVDKDGSGQLTEDELGRALVNGDWSPFDTHTVRMMIRMFDTDRSGTINFDEFCGLWAFLAAWRALFDRFDLDRSGNISLPEFSEALVAFGYRLSGQFVGLLFRTYDRGRGAIGFDLFVQACISLKRMTDVFKRYDEDRDGYITLSFEEFLTGAQQLFLFNSISAVTDTGLY